MIAIVSSIKEIFDVLVPHMSMCFVPSLTLIVCMYHLCYLSAAVEVDLLRNSSTFNFYHSFNGAIKSGCNATGRKTISEWQCQPSKFEQSP